MSADHTVPGRLRHGALRGVWWWPDEPDQPEEPRDGESDGVDLLVAVGAALEWHTVVLDTSPCEGKESFLQACSDTFALPSWFGMNWDALVDCLSDLDVGESMGLLIVWRGWQALASAAPDEFAVALEVLADAAGRWESDGVPGAVLLVGGAPQGVVEPDVRRLGG